MRIYRNSNKGDIIMKYNLINKGLKFIFNPNYRVDILAGIGWYNNMDDRKYLEKIFKAVMGYSLDLDNPKTFNEKIQWLKLNDRKPEYTMMVDKFKVRDYIAEKIGNEYLVPLLGVWDDPNQINFEKLPNQFVLKCNHNSGLGMCICKDKTKLNFNEVRANLRNGLNQDYYLTGREWPYKNVSRKIICEKYMEDAESQKIFDCKVKENCNENKVKLKELKDYKFFCFDGKVKLFKIDYDRFVYHRANYYDGTDKRLLYFGEEVCPPDFERQLDIPVNINDMISLAEKLSEGFPFLRVDFYNVKNRIFFGELTFYPASGFGRFVPPEWDEKIGSWLRLPKIN